MFGLCEGKGKGKGNGVRKEEGTEWV